MRVVEKIKNNKWLVVILIIAAILRFYKVDFQSLWLDETLSMNAGNPKLSFKEFYKGIMYWEYLPHLYFFGLKIFFSIFGYTILVARIYSAIIGVLGVYSIYLLGKELYNKKLGLIAAALLSVNYFHIFHSQEVRPYGMLFLFSVLSFYGLARFLKNVTIRNAVVYGVFAGLVLNSQSFGFITLFSQFLIIIIYLFLEKDSQKRKHFFKFSLIAGIVGLLIFLPAIEPAIRVGNIESFWASKPNNDFYQWMFKEFFAGSEILMWLVYPLIFFYIFNIYKRKTQNISDKYTLGFVILFVWFIISTLIPWIKSNIGSSMMINRYFISLVAVLVLGASFGVLFIKNKIIQRIILFSFLIISVLELVYTKAYYKTVTKSQYRELTQEMIKRNNGKETTLYAYWSWVYPYYFRNNPEFKILNNSLENQVKGLREGALPYASFWYSDANARPYSLNKEDEEYLLRNFKLAEKIEMYDIWAHYYVPNTQSYFNGFDLSQYTGTYDEAIFKHFIDVFSIDDSTLNVSGWIYRVGENSEGTTIKIIVFNDSSSFEIATQNSLRPDVTAFFESNKNLDFSGFGTTFDISVLPKGKYTIGLVLENPKFNQKEIKVTDKTFSVE